MRTTSEDGMASAPTSCADRVQSTGSAAGGPEDVDSGRRRLLAVIAGAPIVTLLASKSADVFAASAAPPRIDIHCHTFNASDLPVRGFVQRIVFGDWENQVVLDRDPQTSKAIGPALAATLIGWLSSAITAKEELALLQSGQASKSARATAAIGPDLDEQMARTLFDVVVGQPGGEMQKADLQLPDLPLETRELFLKALLREAGLDERISLSQRDKSHLYRRIGRGLEKSRGPIGLFWSWSRTMKSARRSIVTEAVKLYGGSEGIGLFTPAIIDFSYWLDDDAKSDLESQIRVAEALQRQALGTQLHFIAPYDPWRQIVDREAGNSNTALDLAKWAVRDMGFVGVKLYPALGFRPSGNAGAGLTFPERAKAVRNFPAKLDAALEELFAWAEAERVPIMTHCMNSQGAAEGYAERSHPDHWRPVLRRHPQLRVNLAHLGGILPISPANSVPWESRIGALMAAAPNSAFADIGYMSEVIEGAATPERRSEIIRRLKEFRQSFDPRVQRMMYGSDWLLLGREPDSASYVRAIQGVTEDLGFDAAQKARFFGLNAARFLGLRSDYRTYQRLEAYCRRNSIDREWLVAFNRLLS